MTRPNPAESAPFEILVEAGLEPLRIEATHEDRDAEFGDDLAEYQRSLLLDGTLFRLTGYTRAGSTLRLQTETTTYAKFRQTRFREVPREQRFELLANPLAVCCVCRTTDGWLMLEQRSPEVELYPGNYHVVGGYSEVGVDERDSRPDFGLAIAREVEEELGVAPLADSLALTGLIFERRAQHPELCYAAEIPLRLEEVRQTTRGTPEFEHLTPVRDSPDELVHFLNQNLDQITPSGCAALILYGRWRYGRSWSASLPMAPEVLESRE